MNTSRRALAQGFLSLADSRGTTHAVRALAAGLISEHRIGEVDLMVQEIARQLWVQKKELHATVTSARLLSAQLKKAITSLLRKKYDAEAVHADFTTDALLIGGFVARTPVGEINASVAHQLSTLKSRI